MTSGEHALPPALLRMLGLAPRWPCGYSQSIDVVVTNRALHGDLHLSPTT